MNIKDNRIISEKNVFRRIAALLITLLLVITVIPDGFSVAITAVAEAAETAVTGAGFDTDSMEIVTYNVVDDFGADNTGNAMTEKQIQQALDAAKENSQQGIFTKVVIPKGTYLISSALVVYSDTWIYCEEGVEIKRCVSRGPMLMCDNNGIGGYDGVKNVIVEGGIWNVKKYTRFHPRCGTSFIFLVLFISIFVNTIFRVSWASIFLRVVIKIALLPIVTGIAYELIRLAGRYDNIFTKIISAPGLWIQRITTSEPDESQIECAIAALKACIPENKEDDKW